MCPIPIPEGLSGEKAHDFYKKEYKERNIDTKQLNPVYVDWRDSNLMDLYKLKQEIGELLASNYVDVKSKEIGGLVLKHIPPDDLLKILPYPEIKELKTYATRVWKQRSKAEYKKLKDKYKAIIQYANEIQEAHKGTYGLRP